MQRVRPDERRTIRSLAEEFRDFAESFSEERARAWTSHDDLRSSRPLLLFYPEGAWREIIPPESLACEDPGLRKMEFLLRARLAHKAILPDSLPIEAVWDVNKRYSTGSWYPREVAKTEFENHWAMDALVGYCPSVWEKDFSFSGGAEGFDPVLMGRSDLKKLRKPVWEYDEAGTLEELELARELLGDLLEVRLRGLRHLSFHVTNVYSGLRGLSQMYYDMYDEAELMHEALELITEGSVALAREAEAFGMLERNADYSYQSSGGVGYTAELEPGGGKVLLSGIWGSAESQEMSSVSPEMHEEFAMRYEARFLSLFGLTGYGCCDGLADKMDSVLKLPGIRRVSVAPWADIERCVDCIGRKAVASIKPNPAIFAGDAYDADAASVAISRSMEAARKGVVEVIVKDTHSCRGDVGRFGRFAADFHRIAKEKELE